VKKALALFALVLAQSSGAWPQACPSPGDLHKLPPTLPMCSGVNPMGWQYGATVNVYISNIFDLGQQLAIESAYNNWNAREASDLLITSHVFNVFVAAPVEPYSEWQVYNDMSEGCVGFDACTHNNWCPGGYEQIAMTNVQPSYTGTGDQLFAHEVGHTYGIDDCTADDCYPAVTIMEQDQADNPISPMAPHCCDSKLMWQISGAYGQSDNYCSATLVQGAAAGLQDWGNTVSTTFQQPPQSGDSIVAGCLGEYATSFSATDNQGAGSNTYNPLVSIDLSTGNGAEAEAALLGAVQVASSQSQSFTVTCSAAGGAGYLEAFALEYADLDEYNNPVSNLDGPPGMNSNLTGASPLSCGDLYTTAANDLIASLYNYNVAPYPTNSADPHPATAGRGGAASTLMTTPVSCAPGPYAPTLGTVPACVGGYDGTCISTSQPGGISVYPQDTPPGPYTEAWTSWLCPPGCNCTNPMSCVSAALFVIGP
jgi:hypothetical protein